MKTLKEMIARFPVISSVAFLFLAIVITDIHFEYLLQGVLGYQPAFYLAVGLIQSIVALLTGVLVARLGLLRNAGLTKPNPIRSIWLIWPIVVLSVLNGSGLFDGTIKIDTSRPIVLVLFVFIAVSTGFFEELVCRGFVLNVLLQKFGRTKKGVCQAMLLSSLLFGVAHFQNLLVGRGTLVQVTTQVIYAFFFGVFFAACFLRFNSLWPSIIAHALFDLMGTLNEIAVGSVFHDEMTGNQSVGAALITLCITLFLFLYGLFLLRRVPERADAAD